MGADPFSLEIIRSSLISTIHEMLKTTARAAYSPTFAEGLDFSCALFDPDGRMVAQAAGVGVHLGSMQPAVRKIIDTYPAFDEADVILTNDPYTATHQADVVVVRPIFWEREHLGFAVNLGHWTDIGSMAPGGCAGTSTHVVQDGLIIPVCRLYRRGVVVREVQEFILRNVRYPEEAWGDLQSQIAACRVAEERLRALVFRYGVETVRHAMRHAIEYARRRFEAKIARLPDGVYQAQDYIEDDGITDREYLVNVRVEKHSGGFVVDFTGSAAQAPTPINSNYSCTRAAVYCGLIAIVDPDTPVNQGVLDLFDVRAPEGTIVNATWPAGVFGNTFEMSKRVGELMFRAFADAAPKRVAAGGFGSGNNLSARCVSADWAKEVMWYYFLEGGQGARQEADGNSAVYHWAGTPTNQPIEVWEHRYPVLFHRYELIPDSGGPGRYRGGLGVSRWIECLWDHYLSGLADRHRIAPWGIHGGREGRPNRWGVLRGGVPQSLRDVFGLKSYSKFYNVHLQKGEVLVLETGGGGGFGNPRERSRELVLEDLREGYISYERAVVDYGLEPDSREHAVDEPDRQGRAAADRGRD